MSQPSIFLACPIGQSGSPERIRSDKLLKYVIRPVADELNCQVTRGDKIAEIGRITLQVAAKLNCSDVVIADLTGLNPNVMYELGVRQALGRPCILMAQVGQSLPFDLLDFRTIFYQLDLDAVEEAKVELKLQLETAISGQGPILSRKLYECAESEVENEPNQAEILDEILSNVRTLLSHQMSTKYLGEFPNFFEQNVVDCIAEARKCVLIACDFPAPGIFSAAEGFEKYIQSLEKVKTERGVSIKMLILNQDRRDALNRLLIPDDNEAWNQLITDKSKSFAKNLADFNIRNNAQVSTPLELYRLFGQLDIQTIERLTKNIVDFIYDVDLFIPMYLWIADSKRAIFSIPTFPDESAKSSEKIEASYGFETRNSDLIVALERIWHWYYKMRTRQPAQHS
ncbi:MAG: hypothetical protein JWQ14_1508 [Adhaeribacter sp.]|jgi:hypothetical protein|nr:hypothetical protein [Adhaeribacter sp.]